MVSSLSQDFSQKIRLVLPSLRVDDLKSILRSINSVMLVTARLTGRKDELVHRIESYLQDAINTNNTENYERIRAVIYRHCREPFIPPFHHGTTTTNAQSTSNRAVAPTVDFGSAPLARLNPIDRSSQSKSNPVFGATSRPSSMIRPPAFNQNSSSSAINNNQKDSLFQSSNALNNPPSNRSQKLFPTINSDHPPYSSRPSTLSNSSSAFSQRSLPINFEKSPFYRIDSAVSSVAVCHRAQQNDRKSVPLSLVFSADQRAKLAQSTQYQIRMFSTSESFYSHPSYGGGGVSLPAGSPALIEFPTTLEMKLNNCLITSNIKGIKKQPGTAAPPDLALVPGRNGIGRALDLRDGKNNQIEIAYSNSDKRFFFVIYLVEYYGVNGLVKNLKTGAKLTRDQVIREIMSSSGDDDVIASASVVSLLDPIVFSRIKTPIRSLKCKHVQCFDAEMFYTMMETTPTWLCPVCNVKLKNDDILIDEYFESILTTAPTKIESVLIESDGKWHDEKYECGTSVSKKQPTRSITSITSEGSSTSSARGSREENEDGELIEETESVSERRLKRKVSVVELESEDDQDLRITSSTNPSFNSSFNNHHNHNHNHHNHNHHNHNHHNHNHNHNKRNRSNVPIGFAPNCVIDLTLDD